MTILYFTQTKLVEIVRVSREMDVRIQTVSNCIPGVNGMKLILLDANCGDDCNEAVLTILTVWTRVGWQVLGRDN